MTDATTGMPVPEPHHDDGALYRQWCQAMIQLHNLSRMLEVAGQHLDARLVRHALVELSKVWEAATYWDVIDGGGIHITPADLTQPLPARRQPDQYNRRGIGVPDSRHIDPR